MFENVLFNKDNILDKIYTWLKDTLHGRFEKKF